MYLAHWGLNESPFRNCLDPNQFYASSSHEESLARLHWLVEQQRRLGLILAEPGLGKSLLLEVFADTMRRAGKQVAKASLLGADVREVLWQLATAMSLGANLHAERFELWRLISDAILENHRHGVDTVLLLDDVEQVSPEVIHILVRLAQLDSSRDSHLTMVLATSPAAARQLGTRLLGLADLRIDLRPWTAEETQGYVEASLARVGREAQTFEHAAIEKLHELTGGVPREVNRTADLCLVASAGEDEPLVSAETVSSVFEQLGVGASLTAALATESVSSASWIGGIPD